MTDLDRTLLKSHDLQVPGHKWNWFDPLQGSLLVGSIESAQRTLKCDLTSGLWVRGNAGGLQQVESFV